MPDPPPAARRIYRILLLAFPRDVRERYGPEMEETFLHILRGAESRLRRAGVWLRAARDALLRGWGMRLRSGSRLGAAAPAGRGRDGGKSGHGGPAHGRGRRGGDGMEMLLSDIRFAARAMARRPVFAATAVATLALGIGANTAIFSLVNGLLVKPLPYPDADRLVILFGENRELGWEETDVNRADAWDWRARSGVLEDLAVYDQASLNLTGGDRPERLLAIEGTWNVLSVLGARPALGRAFTAADGRPGAPLTVVLTHGFWERRFGAVRSAVGSTLVLDEEPATVIGVLPEGFVFPDETPDVYVPLRVDPAAAERGTHDSDAIGRLRSDVTIAEADRAVNDVALRLQEEHPEENAGWTAEVKGLREDMLGDIARQASLVLMGAVGFVLLMACTNVANLLLARGASRRTEMAVRTALGAGRGRILRQLLVESGMLAAAGGVAGLGLAWWGERALVAGLPAEMPPAFRFGLDGTVLGFAALVSVAAALLFGVVPALRASGPSTADLREGGRSGSPDRRARRFGSFLVVGQTTLAVVLLVGAGVMVRSVAGMAGQDMGFEPEGVLTLRMSPPEPRYPDAEALTGFWDRVLEEVRAAPGVESAGAIQALPLGGANWASRAWIPGAEEPELDPGRGVRVGYVTPAYFRTMGVELLRGRDVAPADAHGPPVVLVNERFVRESGTGEDAVGSTVLLAGSEHPFTIVGVVEDHVERGIDQPPEAAVYLPVSRHPVRARTVVARTDGDPSTLVDPLQAAVWSVDPDQPVYEVMTMRDWVARRVGGFRLIAQVMGVFGLISLVLGAVGIYGVTSYAVGRRTSEIGIRMAMGADRGRVVGMVVREGLGRVLLGLALGMALALALSRAMESLLVGVSPTDPLTFLTVPTLLLAVSLLGSWIPARRASGVDPSEALRVE